MPASTTTRVALAIVVYSLISAVLSLVYMSPNGAGIAVAGLLVNLGLAYYLHTRAPWARWWMIFRCELGAFAHFAPWSKLSEHAHSVSPVFLYWSLSAAVFTLVTGLYLLFSRRVCAEFNTSPGF